MQKGKKGRVAFITTPEYRRTHPQIIENFIYRYLYPLCASFDVLVTGRTFDFIVEKINRPITEVDTSRISDAMKHPIEKEDDLSYWRQTIKQGLERKLNGIRGMVEITYELVEGRLDAVIHLTDWGDVAGKPDSMVLRREANVHNVPIASDIHTARVFISNWNSLMERNLPIFSKRNPPSYTPLQGLTSENKVLALIAHDGMKLDMCCFFVEYAKKILDKFEYILATGTTGMWLKKFVLAAGRSQHDANRIRCCLSGPKGGDVQIAAAVVKKYCHTVIFLQDPHTSHPHETDIRLFEQSVLLFERASLTDEIDVELATNIESAKAILGV